jgi:hypothetical protein
MGNAADARPRRVGTRRWLNEASDWLAGSTEKGSACAAKSNKRAKATRSEESHPLGCCGEINIPPHDCCLSCCLSC